jgi:beta-lactamase regulating signal transducer with metallopeptidase domain
MNLADTASAFFQFWSAFQAFAHWAAPAAVAALWQGAVVAAGLALCLRLSPRIAAAHRFAAWAAGFGVVACLPALPLLARLSAEFAGAAATTAPTIASAATHPWLEFDERWSLAIAGLWFALSVYRATDLAIHTLRLRRLWSAANPIEDGMVSSLASSLLLGHRKVEICTTSETTTELDRPSVIGFFAPRILIPDWLLARLTHEELEQVILHEAEHLRRRDDWTNLVQKLCLAVFPLNPALAWMERRLSKEREMACDEGVVRLTGAPRAYAACLASLAERGLEKNLARDFARRAEALSLGAFERRPELVHRVHSILFGGKMLSPLAGRALLGAVGCGLLFGSVELARCPQMVAFVPMHSASQRAAVADAAQMLPAGYHPARRGEGFRAVNAVAIMPTRAQQARAAQQQPADHIESNVQSSIQSFGSRSSRAVDSKIVKSADLAGNGPHEELLKAQMDGAESAAAHAPQQWLVVTEWQVQTATFRAQNVADYDEAAPASDPESANATGSQLAAAKPASSVAVTRMVLTVYTAAPVAQTAGQAKNKAVRQPTATSTELKSLPNRPAIRTLTRPFGAVPFGDGWLVIQL